MKRSVVKHRAAIFCPTGAQEAVDYIVRILNGETINESEKRVILEPKLISNEKDPNI